MIQWYDRAGKPIAMEQANELLADPDYRRVAEDTIGPYWVSTVWLGLDHGFMRNGVPIIFETMVFLDPAINDDSLSHDLDCDRYPTEAAALKGHEAMCTLIRATVQTDAPTQEHHDTEH